LHTVGFRNQNTFLRCSNEVSMIFFKWKVLLISCSKANIIICHTSYLTSPLNSFLLFSIITFAFHSFLPFSPSSQPPFLLSFLLSSPPWYSSFLPCCSHPRHRIRLLHNPSSLSSHPTFLSTFLLSSPSSHLPFLPSFSPTLRHTHLTSFLLSSP
jgi:hypothetical protein